MRAPRFPRRRSGASAAAPAQSGDPHLRGQAYAADVDKQLRQWPARRVATWVMLTVAVLIAAQHLLAHAGLQPLPFTMGWQDILVGYPTAAVLAIGALMLLDPRPRV